MACVWVQAAVDCSKTAGFGTVSAFCLQAEGILSDHSGCHFHKYDLPYAPVRLSEHASYDDVFYSAAHTSCHTGQGTLCTVV